MNHATEMKQSEYKYPCLGDTLELWGSWVRFGLYTKILSALDGQCSNNGILETR